MHIERYFSPDTLVPELRAAGQSRQTEARLNVLEGHRHDHAVEICLINNGAVNWWVEDRSYRIPSNSIFITRPGEEHGSVGSVIEPCELSWFQVSPEAVSGDSMEQIFLQEHQRLVSGGQSLVPHLEAILAECRQPQPESEAMIRGHLQLLLASIVRRFHQASFEHAAWRYVERALDYAKANPVRWPTVAHLCEAAGIGSSRLNELFRECFGQSPMRYLMQQRLQRAQHLLLTTDRQISDIAHELGFSSGQHFSTVFRRYHGTTPTRFRKQVVF